MCTGIKNQGYCGACWAFAATEVLESAYALSKGGIDPVAMAQQELVTCATFAMGDSSDQCGGGYVRRGIGYGLTYGMQPESFYSNEFNQATFYTYPPTVGSCVSNLSASVQYQFPDFCKYSASDATTIKSYLSKYGPATVDVDASHWGSLGSSIIDSVSVCSSNAANADHSLVLIGWGTEESTGRQYWLLRNQWGTDWVY